MAAEAVEAVVGEAGAAVAVPEEATGPAVGVQVEVFDLVAALDSVQAWGRVLGVPAWVPDRVAPGAEGPVMDGIGGGIRAIAGTSSGRT